MNNIFIIVEGTDRCGKSTLIQNLKNKFNSNTLHALHYSAVKQTDSDDVVRYSEKLYNEMFTLMNFVDFSSYNSGVICDRSHLGEKIYGPIYRGYTGDYVFDIEKKFENKHFWNRLFLITLYDNPENLIDRDDGLSFTTDLEKKQTEIDGFLEAHSASLIRNKLLININNHNASEASNVASEFIESAL